MMLPVNSLVYDVLPAQMDNTGFLSRGSSCGTPDDTPGALGWRTRKPARRRPDVAFCATRGKLKFFASTPFLPFWVLTVL